MKYLVPAVLLFAGAHSVQATVLDRVEASVNGQTILLSDVSKFRKTLGLRSQLDPLFSGTTLARKGNRASDKEIVDFTINERLISQQFPIEDSLIEKEIKLIQANNKISRDELIRALKAEGYDFSDYFSLIRTSMAKRNLIDRDIQTKVHISEDDVKNYFYNSYHKGGKGVLSYSIRIIRVDRANYKTAAGAMETIRRAKKAVESGEPFAAVAKRVSDDFSAKSGGDLGTLSDDEMSGEIKSAVKGLKVGQLSKILGDKKKGYYFLKLTDIKSGQEKRLQRMKDKIREQLASKEYQLQIKLWLERERQKAHVRLAGQPSILKK